MLFDNNKKRVFKKFRRKAHADLAVEAKITEPVAPGATTIQIFAFNPHEFIDKEIIDINELDACLAKYAIVWVQVIGIRDVAKLEEIASHLQLHKLAMEDIINSSQRPKIEEYDEFMLAVTRIPKYNNEEFELEQISLAWSSKFIISFMESRDSSGYLNPLLHRLRNENKRQQILRPEYIAYSIIDIIIDSFFPLLESYGQKLDDIEDDAVANPSSQIIVNIHSYKHDLLNVRRAMWSQREALRKLVEFTKFDEKELRFFIRDCEDHAMQIIDILESYRERTGALMDIYLSSVNNKMNEIMKVLTMISTIFMPTGVIASIYGMNFDRTSPWNMPELAWKYGYEYALGLMLTIAIIFIFYFKRKGWILTKKKKSTF